MNRLRLNSLVKYSAPMLPPFPNVLPLNSYLFPPSIWYRPLWTLYSQGIVSKLFIMKRLVRAPTLSNHVRVQEELFNPNQNQILQNLKYRKKGKKFQLQNARLSNGWSGSKMQLQSEEQLWTSKCRLWPKINNQQHKWLIDWSPTNLFSLRGWLMGLTRKLSSAKTSWKRFLPLSLTFSWTLKSYLRELSVTLKSIITQQKLSQKASNWPHGTVLHS